ncbi:polymorphic outer membrane protein middle domain-containing protein [Chlamydia crocodili]|uniref:polymorphic outer membrane protein middle domain-containing protein n=1 Tax=Chlamydia crocodili TaxID=2766982 RepID=UPI003D5566D1
MKHPVYWFLISSGLIASTSLSFAAPKEETLNSSNSYNGNDGSNTTFNPKESSETNGMQYTCNGNVCIAYADTNSKSCFSQTNGDLFFLGNGYSLCFDNITSTNKPGAIEVSTDDKQLSISGFSVFSCSYCPPGTTGQGAIQSKGLTNFKDNAKIIFDRNCSTEEGGAVKCGTGSNAELKFEGNQNLIFSGNSSQKKGGAIFAKKLTISSEGPTLFSANSVSKDSDPKGGAICIDTSGECNLTANRGDIVFDGNKVITTSGTKKTIRNAIDISTSGKFTQLRAKDGFAIFFYDPVTGTGATDELKLNDAAGSEVYNGKIIFSGEKLSLEEKVESENFKSTFKQALKLESGSLVLKNGVILEAKSFTQTAGSVVMDLGTTLETSSTGGENISLSNLSVNIASLGGGGVPLQQPLSNLKPLQKPLLSPTSI